MKLRYILSSLALCASIESKADVFDSILCYNQDIDPYAIDYSNEVYDLERYYGLPIDLAIELEKFFYQSQSYAQWREGQSMWLELPNTFLTTETPPVPNGEVIEWMSLVGEITYGVECEFDMSLDNQFILEYQPPKPPTPSIKKTVVFIHTDLLGSPIAETDEKGNVR